MQTEAGWEWKVTRKRQKKVTFVDEIIVTLSTGNLMSIILLATLIKLFTSNVTFYCI